ncbi:transcription regulator protein [Rhodovulum sulfidophilum]|uniref:Transcription regulator protein n=1 Tax=Rhodovulum sulfidophilum TaxID=35806 RepID=A0A0D6B982_RHOSU|nr:transcription regulator protein [Rhodovulum sulfidophilum]
MVREAMRALAVLGVIEIRPGGGAWVSALDASSLLSQLNVFLGLFEISVDELCQARRPISRRSILRQQAVVEADLDSDFHAPLAKPADPFSLARAAQSLAVPGLEFRKAAAHTDGMARRSIAASAKRRAQAMPPGKPWPPIWHRPGRHPSA